MSKAPNPSSSYSGTISKSSVTTTTTIPSPSNSYYKKPCKPSNNHRQNPPIPGGCYGGYAQYGSWPYRPCVDPYTGQVAYTYNYGNLMPPATCTPYMMPVPPPCCQRIETKKKKKKNQKKKSKSNSTTSESSSSSSSSGSSTGSSSGSEESTVTESESLGDSKMSTTNTTSNSSTTSTTTTSGGTLSSKSSTKTGSTNGTDGTSSSGSYSPASNNKKGCCLPLCPPNNVAPVQNACLGMYPQTTQAMEARYTKLPPEWPPKNKCLSQAPEDEEGLNFKFQPRSDFATEVTFTIEPKKKPLWQTMMACGFRPMITTSAPPFVLPPNFQQHNRSQYSCDQKCKGPKTSSPTASTKSSPSSSIGKSINSGRYPYPSGYYSSSSSSNYNTRSASSYSTNPYGRTSSYYNNQN